MEENPKAVVDFSYVDFSYKVLKERFPDNENLQKIIEENKDEEVISFSEYKFSGDANFNDAEFSGNVSFWRATFSGKADFYNATFNGDAKFSMATFSGDAKFNATFNGDADFNDASFSGEAGFDNAIFKGKADFFDVDFGDNVSFCKTILGSNPNFASSTFNSKSRFEPLNAKTIRSLNFKGSSFEKHFSLKGKFKCIPELRQTKTSHHVDLSNLEVSLNRDFINKFWKVEKALDEEDSERLCRLKEIAESNKNNERALAFHADEMRAKRLWNRQTWPKDILDCYYSVTSNYGQSIARPFCLLVVSIFMFALFTMSQATADKNPRFKDAVTVSIATVTPFISISKGARDKGLSRLYGENIPDDYDLYSYLHAGISFIFIFLIGLGLRNRFRI